MGKARNWTPEEEEYLRENWGTMTYAGIAKRLGRTVCAVKLRAGRIGLGPYLDYGDYITFHQLSLALGNGASSDKHFVKSWGEKRGLPIHNKRRGKSVTRVVYLEEFWEWAEKNRSFLDFSKMEPLALGMEPDWLVEQRKKDHQAYVIQRKDRWTQEEDSRLKMLLGQQRYPWSEICDMMHRSHGAISRRCRDLGIKDRPVSLKSNGKRGTWTEDGFKALADGIRHGDSYAAIGKTNY